MAKWVGFAPPVARYLQSCDVLMVWIPQEVAVSSDASNWSLGISIMELFTVLTINN